ncbi:MAG: YkgJ family cysteine cluster protein [Bacteriovoracaceae bacterium]
MNIREFALNLQKIYDEMGQTFSLYQNQTGLHCLNSCGKCCLNPEIEASILEMIPMALRIFDDGKLEEWLAKLEDPQRDYCLAYQGSGEKGQCTLYEQRPSVCRMFGVAGYYNKQQEITLSICKYIKEFYSDEIKNLEPSNLTPVMATWSSKLTSLDPQLILERKPINSALKEALHKVALYAQYQEKI